MRHSFAVILSFAFIPLIFTACGESSYPAIPERISDFKATNAAGDSVAYSSVKGNKATLVTFHASWCGYCIAEMPLLKQLSRDYGDKGFHVIGIDEDDEFPTMAKLIAAEGLDAPDLHWTELYWNYKVYAMFGSPKAIPANFLLDSLGRIRSRAFGPIEEQSTRKAIELLLSGK